MTNKKGFVIYDQQCYCYLSDGEIYESFEEALGYVISYFSYDHTAKELETIATCYSNGKSYADIEIIQKGDDNND